MTNQEKDKTIKLQSTFIAALLKAHGGSVRIPKGLMDELGRTEGRIEHTTDSNGDVLLSFRQYGKKPRKSLWTPGR